MSDLPSLKKEWCPFCMKWIPNSSIEGGVLFIHDYGVEHPADAINYFSTTRIDN